MVIFIKILLLAYAIGGIYISYGFWKCDICGKIEVIMQIVFRDECIPNALKKILNLLADTYMAFNIISWPIMVPINLHIAKRRRLRNFNDVYEQIEERMESE